MLAELVALVVPPRCATCRAPGLRAGDALCPGCRRALPWLREARCERCGLPSPCGPCPARRAAFAASWAPMAYEGVARDAVRALKFGGARPLADVMAGQIVATAPAAVLPAAGAVLVGVPADPRRRRARGFDPAELLARAIGRRTGLPVQRALGREGPAPRQLGASRRSRLAPGRVAVTARRRAAARVVLVDDVHTTGATLDACAGVLRGAGAHHVAAVTWARTLATR